MSPTGVMRLDDNDLLNYYAATMGLLQIAGLRFQYQFGAVAFAALLVFLLIMFAKKPATLARQS
jgi:hypothetical protein